MYLLVKNLCKSIHVLVFYASLSFYSPAHAADFFERTHLIELKQGSELSEKVNFYTVGGVESANGTFISYSPWYVNQWTDARITWMTQITEHIGILWGFSTGEHGEKYRIDPSIKLGFAYFESLSKNASLSFKFTSIIGGNLNESACIADYGEIGGVQPVNCRMAASPVPPQETLSYLFSDRPYNQTVLFLEYKYIF